MPQTPVRDSSLTTQLKEALTLLQARWTEVETWLKAEIGNDAFNSWFASLQPDRMLEPTSTSEKASVTLAVPTPFIRDWIAKNYADVLQQGLTNVFKHPVDVSYVIRPVNTAAKVTESPIATPEVEIKKGEGISSDEMATLYDGTPLDPRFTFDNFVTGKSNEFAFAAAKRIAESDDLAYNPFVLHGGVGLGKTHLMHAIAHYMCEHSPKKRVLYISAEKFLYQFIRALRDRSTMSFKETFRSVDVLMIDDVQFIAGKDATQEEFFHTFNTLVDMQKQVILTADKSPLEMDGLEDRLRSRLGNGLSCEIHSPDLETRLAILEKKAISLNLDLKQDVAMLLASSISSNVRELEGALKRLAAHANLVNANITVDFAKENLKDLFRVYNRQVTIDDIQRQVASYYNVKITELHGARRSRNIVRPRQIAMYLVKQLTSKSFPDIGRAFGGRDHTTVIHAVKAVEKLSSEDQTVADDLTLLEKILQGTR